MRGARLVLLVAWLAANGPTADCPAGTVVGWGRSSEGQLDIPPDLTNAVAVAAGYYHSAAVLADGRVEVWGTANYGLRDLPANLTNAVAVAAGVVHNLVLKADGTVVAWGDNFHGQTNPPPGLGGVIAIAAGRLHNLALLADGRVVAWGGNSYGQANVPPRLSNVVSIAAGTYHSLALRHDGSVIGWGATSLGESVPPRELGEVIGVAAGAAHSVALKPDGSVVPWGHNQSGETNIPANLTNGVALAAGWYFSLVLQSDGTVVAWGANSVGETTLPSGLSNVVGIVASHQHGLALLGNGAPTFVSAFASRFAYVGATVTLNAKAAGAWPLRYQWTWNGTNLPGATNATLVLPDAQVEQSGRYAVIVSNALGAAFSPEFTLTIDASPPVVTLQPASQITFPGGGPVRFRVEAQGPGPLQFQWMFEGSALPGATNAEFVVDRVLFENLGRYAVAVTNVYGGAVSADAVLSISPVWAAGGYTTFEPNCDYHPVFVPPDLTNEVVAVAGGYHHSMALRKDGRVAAWGIFGAYFCGDLDFGQANVPPDLTKVVAIAAGAYHCLGVRSDGTVAAWGRNDLEQTQVPAGLGEVVGVAAGRGFSLALRADGMVVAWGRPLIATNVPPGLTDVVAIAGGTEHALALRGDGTVVAWGRNSSGRISVPPGLSNVVAIAAGDRHSVALRADGTVVGWGTTWTAISNSPPDWTNLVAIAAGRNFSLGLAANGTTVRWDCNPCPPAALTNVVQIAGGFGHVLAMPAPESIVRSADLAMGRLRWLSSGEAPWFAQTNVTHDGSDALQSGAIGHGQKSRLRTTVFGPSTISFWWKVSSEVGGDSLRFFIDGNEQASISGELDWAQRAFTIPAGTHDAEWVYSKDASGSQGHDATWLDDVRFLPRNTLEPVISTQPADQTVYQGTTAIFRPGSRVLGMEPLLYQWLFNGVEIAEATNHTFTLGNVQVSHAGFYSVVVSNAHGVTVSSNALLTVLYGQPQVSAWPTNTIASLGQTTTLEAMITAGNAPMSFQWLFDGVELPWATNAVLELPRVGYAQAGNYSVRVSNEAGEVTSSNATLAVVPVAAWGDNSSRQTNLVASLTNVVAVSGGVNFSLALRGDGTVAVWGINNLGQFNLPPGLTKAVAISAGNGHGLALKPDGTVAAWGLNQFSQALVPAGVSNVVTIAAGADHSLALQENGTVIGWGNDQQGQASRLPTGLVDAVVISGGGLHSLALRRDGRVIAWGDGGFGQTNVPAGLSNVVAIAAGGYHNLALRSDGSVVGWGHNGYGQSTAPSNLSNVVAVAAGAYFSMALQEDHALVAWGLNDRGQANVPLVLSNFLAIAAGNAHAVAILGDGLPTPPAGPSPEILGADFTGSAFNVRVPTLLGKVYALEFKESLSDLSWTALPMSVGDGTVKTLKDPAADVSRRFYRVRQWR